MSRMCAFFLHGVSGMSELSELIARTHNLFLDGVEEMSESTCNHIIRELNNEATKLHYIIN